MIVAMSGLDGAGKSTQIAELTKRLKADNFSSKVIWARGGYTPLFEMLKNLVRLIARKKLPPPGITKERKKHLSNPYIQKIWLIIATIDLILLWGIYVRFMSKLGFFIICDRYINDTLLDFRRNFPESQFEDSVYWALLRFMVPKPDHHFVLWIPVEVALSRSNDKEEPFPDDKETLSWRLSLYLDKEIFPRHDCISFDGRLCVNKIANEIYKKINPTIKKGN